MKAAEAARLFLVWLFKQEPAQIRQTRLPQRGEDMQEYQIAACQVSCMAQKTVVSPQWCQTLRITVFSGDIKNNTYLCFYQVLSITQGSAAGVKSMLKEKISLFIDKIRSIDGVAACALVSRDGIISGKFFDRELNEPWFGALSATILASAESVGSIIKSRSMLSVTIRAQDTSVMIMGAGENFLISAIISDKADPAKVHAEMLAVAQKIGEAM
jgi:predicted regulator of Ras-like GTPase activity (Roadblock/LC7/MglB family)